MDKIAIFISGRLTCYETNLIHTLTILDNKYDIYLFASINGERDEYHINAENFLSKWLKDIRYEKYICPIENNTHIHSLLQNVNGKYIPYTVMSCFYNDMKAFELIEKYEIENSMCFDVYCKLRADMNFFDLNSFNFEICKKDEKKLYTSILADPIRFYGYHNVPLNISDAFAYGNKEIMKIYCNTYNFGIEMNAKYNGNFRINYEPLLTESILDTYVGDISKHYTPDDIINAYNNNPRGIEIIYFNCPYNLNGNRRHRDIIKYS